MMPMETDPFVTIVMPVRNEAQFIARSLGAVLAQDYPQDRMEILIADGVSDDATCELIRQLAGPDRVRTLPNPRRIQAAGLNVAIAQATGDFILRVDGHTIIEPDYVRQCIAALQETGAQNVGGAMNPVGITSMGRAIAAAGKSAFAVPSAFHVSNQPAFTDTVYLGAWPRRVFQELGGYDERFVVNEDYELNYRIRENGGRIFFSPTIRSSYYGRQTLNALARQYFRYGVSKVATLCVHPRSVRPRQLIAPLFVMGLVMGAALALVDSVFAVLYLFAIACYVAINLLFSLRVAARTDWSLVRHIPLVFAVIHLTWGAGFWVGIVRAATRSKGQTREAFLELP